MSEKLDPVAAEIRQLLGVTDDKRETRGRFAIRNAQNSCQCCAQCGCAIAPGAPIWRQQISLGRGFFGGWRLSIAPHCEQCKSKLSGFEDPQPCKHCGRPVHQEYGGRDRRFTFCCEMCAKAVHSAIASTAAKEHRAEARSPRPCEACGETFEPARADARFCSSVCKQRAYRRRNKGVTDDECVAEVVFASRNAGGGAK
jgi:hypothetical protein